MNGRMNKHENDARYDEILMSLMGEIRENQSIVFSHDLQSFLHPNCGCLEISKPSTVCNFSGCFVKPSYTLVNSRSNGKSPRIEDVFPIEHGDIPASYVIVYQRVG